MSSECLAALLSLSATAKSPIEHILMMLKVQVAKQFSKKS
jgi:hypothetical protein